MLKSEVFMGPKVNVSEKEYSIEKARASRAGHTFHERWTARRALKLVFPQDDLHAIAIEGLSTSDPADPGKAAEEVADLVLYYGSGDTFETCEKLDTIQFKYRTNGQAATSSYLKKTIQKFADTITGYEKEASPEEVDKKLSFSFVTNCEFAGHLWEAIRHLQGGDEPDSKAGRRQLKNLAKWCDEKGVKPSRLFARTTFQAGTADLAAHNRRLRRTLCDWSAGADYQSRTRLFELTELVREKAGPRGQSDNLIKREDVLDALGCDLEDLFPAETRFIDVGEVVPRPAQAEVSGLLRRSDVPVFLHADGGVGKTVFVQSLASEWNGQYEVVIFDCFGGGAYRSEDQGRHLPQVGLLQIVNELAARGLCDPMLPTDNDTLGIIKATRKRLEQASHTISTQSPKQGLLVVLDAADNAQIEAMHRNERAFPKLLLSSLEQRPIDGVKLLLTARTHRMPDVVGDANVAAYELLPFNHAEIEKFVKDRRSGVSGVEMARAIARSGGNARVLDYLVKSWPDEIRDQVGDAQITVDELIANRCNRIVADLHLAGWNQASTTRFFAAISLLPPPIPPDELAGALDWSTAEVRSAMSDLAPMLETISHGAIFRDEPTETYIRETYSQDTTAQQEIADRLFRRQSHSMYAAQALPRFLEAIDDVERAYTLAETEVYPSTIQTDFGKRRLKLARLQAAFSLAVKREDFNLLLKLSMQMAHVASANTRGDEYVRRSPELAVILGDHDANRRLLSDRSGWHGARNCRLTLAYCFLGELEEAEIHYERAVAWINWHFRQREKDDRVGQDGPMDFDFASVMFFSIVTGRIDVADRNLSNWGERFSQRVANLLVELAREYDLLTGNSLQLDLAVFARSKACQSLVLQVALLASPQGLREKSEQSGLARAAGSLARETSFEKSPVSYDDKHRLEADLCRASFAALVQNSKQSAKRVLQVWEHERPSQYDFGERHGPSRAFAPVLGSCLNAWVNGRRLTYHDLLPQQATVRKYQKRLVRRDDTLAFLKAQMVTYPNGRKDKNGKPVPQRRFDDSDCRKICDGIEKVVAISTPIEEAVLRRNGIKSTDFHEFLSNWKTHVRNVHWNSEQATDFLTRTIGLGFAVLILQHSDHIDEADAQTLVDIVSGERFSIQDRLDVLIAISQREELRELAGRLGRKISEWVSRDEYVEQRGENYRNLTKALLPLGIEESREYYKEGLAQLDQMGGDDHDLVYSTLRYAETQRGGFLKPELSQRLMNLCQIIAHHEPSKFGWTLFSSAAASSIGFPAVYKLLRWADQEVSDYSYGLPQLVSFLAQRKQLDPKRGASILTVCEDHGWHDWQVGRGLRDILSAAQASDHAAIASVVLNKLRTEHCDGGWDSLWGGVLETLQEYPGLVDQSDLDQLNQLKKDSYERRNEDNERRNSPSRTYHRDVEERKKKEADQDAEFNKVVSQCDPKSALSIDEAIQAIKENKFFEHGTKDKLLETIGRACPVEHRIDFVNALCEVRNLYFDDAVDHIIRFTKRWQDSSAYLANNKASIVERLFAFRGSAFFDLRYTGITRQYRKLVDYCGSPKAIAHLAARTVANERLILGGDEWLELASCISEVAEASAGLAALELLLKSPLANVGDEIGEGAYHDGLAPPTDEVELVADVFWHVLGNEDAFVRWNSARGILALAQLGLFSELDTLLERVGAPSSSRLQTENHRHAYFNAEQWLLIGLARATRFEAAKLSSLAPKLENLFHSPRTHVLSKVLIARSLSNIWRGTSEEHKALGLWTAINVPPQRYTINDSWPAPREPNRSYRFDYDFNKSKVSDLARLFGISNGEASDAIFDVVQNEWPGAEDMDYFPGHERFYHHRTNRYETFREHVQRHALLKAATEIVATRSVVRKSYESDTDLPWPDWISDFDLTFEDGTWLADHKDETPTVAHQFLLGPRSGSSDTLCPLDELLGKIGLLTPDEFGMIPIYGTWRSHDGVNVRVVSSLVKSWGAVRRCKELAKLPDHELWLPMLDSDGSPHTYHEASEFIPWIWHPELYRYGIDEEDKFAARPAATRAKIGPKYLEAYRLATPDDEKNWFCFRGEHILQSTVWGCWTSGTDGYFQEEGDVLRASRDWLDKLMSDNKLSIAFHLHVEKYKSFRRYDTDNGEKFVGVGLLSPGHDLRFWPAKLASKKRY